MYISDKALYFHSYFNDSIMFLSKVGTKFKILISDIKDVAKAKNAVIFDNSIELLLMNGQKVFFTSFIQRDQCYRLILGQMKKIRGQES